MRNEVTTSQIQGLVCFHNGNITMKIVHDDYSNMFNVRGNEPSLKYRYLQIRMDKANTEKFFQLYPDHVPVFEDYENSIFEISKKIHRAYIERFIKKNFVTVPREEYMVVIDCHQWHIQCREKNKVTLEKVIAVLNRQPASNLNHMIRRYKGENNENYVQPRTINNTPEYKGSTGNQPTPLTLANYIFPRQ
jgi:hypothetical protein